MTFTLTLLRRSPAVFAALLTGLFIVATAVGQTNDSASLPLWRLEVDEGDRLRGLGEHARAEQEFRRALAELEEIGAADEVRGVVLGKIAVERDDQGAYAEAEELSRRSLALVAS